MLTPVLGSKTTSCQDLLPLLDISYHEWIRMSYDAKFAVQQLWLSLIAWDDACMCYRWDLSIDAATVNDNIEVYAAEIWDEVGNVRMS